MLNFGAMAQFVIEREVVGAGNLSELELREDIAALVASAEGLGPEIQWLHSYVTEDKVYCVYLAPETRVRFGSTRASRRNSRRPYLSGAPSP